jgi:hypothetical protein
MEDLLRSKGLYRITLGKTKEPIDADKKVKWANRSDKACGLIIMFISPDLRFHLKEIDDLDEAWEKIETVFGKLNIIRAQQLENKVLTLNPSEFSCIRDYISNFKTLKFLCEEREITTEEERCIYLILFKPDSAYSMFVSTFYAMREALGTTYKKPTLEFFCVALIREEDKLVQLGVINTGGISNKVLVAQ